MATVLDEGKTSTHTIDFFEDEECTIPVVPESAEYRLMASATVEVVPWTAIPNGDLGESITVEISAEDNTIGDVGRKRFLTVRAIHSGGKVITAELTYLLNDLKGI